MGLWYGSFGVRWREGGEGCCCEEYGDGEGTMQDGG